MSTAIKSPPHSVEAEEGLLSAIFVDGGETLSRAINAGVRTRSFYSPVNRIVFEILSDLLARGVPPDQLALAEELKTRGHLDAVGGYGFLSRVAASASSTANANYLIGKVQDYEKRRSLIERAQQISEACFNTSIDLAEGVDAPLSRMLATFASSQEAKEPTWDETVDAATGIFDSMMENKGLPADMVIGFPWSRMDELFGPMQRGQLVVLAARTSVGKSSLARPIALHAAINGHPVYFVTLEVAPKKVPLQMVAALTRIGVREIPEAHPRDQASVRSALLKLKGLGITISSKDRSIVRICARARELHAKGKLDLLIVDHGHQTQEVMQANKENLIPAISRLTKSLKQLATELDIVCVLLWQLNRSSTKEDREPNLTDLKDSGALEEDADKVLLIHRPSFDPIAQQDQKENSTVNEQPSYFQNIIQAKGRDDGTSLMSFYFRRATASFEPVRDSERI